MQLEDFKIIQTTTSAEVTDKVIVSKAEEKLPKTITLENLRNSMFDSTVTPSGTNGARTINRSAGSVNFAIGAASVVVTNSLVTTDSIILATVATNDATMFAVEAVAANGSFTLFGNATPTAATRVNFLVIN
jgi:hypothetical protein